MNRKQIEAKIATLQEQQQNLLNEANRQLGAIAGKIELLQEMLANLEIEPAPNGKVKEKA